MAKKAQPKCPVRLFPPLSVDELAWKILLDKLSARATRLISRHIADLHCDSLREQVYKISEIPANELQISVTNAELSSIFGRKGSWSRGMILEYLHQLSSSHALRLRPPRLVSKDLEAKLV
jgi:hypothetical protein